MHTKPSTHSIPAGLLLGLILPALVLGAEPDNNKDDRQQDETRSTMVILGDDGEELTLTIDDGALTVVSTDDGETTTSIVDLEAVGLIAADAVEEALAEMDDVFAELEDMQFQFRMGQDNRLNLSYDDTDFELDLDQILTQVASAVQMGLDEINTSEWTSQNNRWDGVSDNDLRDELDNLKDEMKELRRELRRLQKAEDGR